MTVMKNSSKMFFEDAVMMSTNGDFFSDNF